MKLHDSSSRGWGSYLITHWRLLPHSPDPTPTRPEDSWVPAELRVVRNTHRSGCIPNISNTISFTRFVNLIFCRRTLTYGTDERGRKVVLGETEQDAGLSHARVAYQEQFKQVIVSFRHRE